MIFVGGVMISIFAFKLDSDDVAGLKPLLSTGFGTAGKHRLLNQLGKEECRVTGWSKGLDTCKSMQTVSPQKARDLNGVQVYGGKASNLRNDTNKARTDTRQETSRRFGQGRD